MSWPQTEHWSIARATLEDLDQIVRIEQLSFSSPWTRKMFEVEISQNPFGSLLTACLLDDGQQQRPVIGYVCYWLVFEELRLMTLAVDPSVRRRRIASTLVRHVLTLGGQQGATRAVLEVRASNQAARSLYAGFGFRHVAVRSQYYSHPTEDAVLMAMDPLMESMPPTGVQPVMVERGGTSGLAADRDDTRTGEDAGR
jgi:[ribosomal protein S18]-alanine N-acetyltransferase